MERKHCITYAVLGFLSKTAFAQEGGALESALVEFKVFLYWIVAGIATVLLVVQAIRFKLAQSPEEREDAKRGMMFIILGLIVVMAAAFMIELLYDVPEQEDIAELINTSSE